MMMIDVDPKIKKKKGAEYFERPEDLDDDWVKAHQESEVEAERQKITKKFEKENEKLAADGEKEMKPKELESRLEKADDLAAKYKKENKTGKVEAEGKGPTIAKLETAVEKLDQRIENMKVQMEDKEGNKEVALGTSKIVSLLVRLAAHLTLTTPRTTSTRVLLSSSRRNSMFLSSASSQRLCARSLIGPSNQSTRIGSSRIEYRHIKRPFSHRGGSQSARRKSSDIFVGLRSGHGQHGGSVQYSYDCIALISVKAMSSSRACSMRTLSS
jgi:hypothetical protein